jgi:hypothetical protein
LPEEHAVQDPLESAPVPVQNVPAVQAVHAVLPVVPE